MKEFYPTRTNRTGLDFGDWYRAHGVFHPGVDFNYGSGNSDKGQPVTCPWWGIVEYVSPRGFNGGLGLYVVVYHPADGLWTRYLHMDSVNVKIGQKLAPKQQLGTLGNTGTTSAHLHFELLTFDGIQYIKNYSRPYGRYPVGMPREEMQLLWKNPIPWLDSLEGRDARETEDLKQRLKNSREAIVRAKGVRKLRLQRAIEYVLNRLGVVA